MSIPNQTKFFLFKVGKDCQIISTISQQHRSICGTQNQSPSRTTFTISLVIEQMNTWNLCLRMNQTLTNLFFIYFFSSWLILFDFSIMSLEAVFKVRVSTF